MKPERLWGSASVYKLLLLLLPSLVLGESSSVILTGTTARPDFVDTCSLGAYRHSDSWLDGCPGFTACPRGSFCSNGTATPCPAGTYSDEERSVVCAGRCKAGFYCPPGSSSATRAPCGGPAFFCPAGTAAPIPVQDGYYSLNDSASVEVCPRGSWCKGGIRHPCPAGTYGAAEGISTPECSGLCEASWHCPAGSVSAVAHPCGDSKVFCPAGSGKPQVVLKGYYAAGPGEGGYGSQVMCQAGSYCEGGVKKPCPAGRYGSTRQLFNTTCTGECREGFFCPEGSSRPDQERCGGGKLYCPAGSGAPMQVRPGFFTVMDEGTSTDSSGDDSDATTQDTRLSEKECLPGHYCSSGFMIKCPAGRFGSVRGLASPDCEGPAQEGYYTPEGSTSATARPCGSVDVFCPSGAKKPQPVHDGYYTTGGSDDTTATREVKCSPGSYCIGGVRRLCPAGRYGSTYGLDSEACTGPCLAGYYCPEGSKVAAEAECGDASLYCPTGSAKPVVVSEGLYSLGQDDVLGSTMAFRVLPAPPGSYAVNGVKNLCPAGTWGARTGLRDVACEGKCKAGYFCPAGSTSRTQKACGGPSFFCPEGSGFPLAVSSGYFTSIWSGPSDPANTTTDYYSNDVGDGGYEPGQLQVDYISRREDDPLARDVCPPGYYRNTTGDPTINQGVLGIATQVVHPCQLCPPGTYKPDAGDDLSSCRSCPPYSSFSTPDRQTCWCYRMDGGAASTTIYFNQTAGACVNATSKVASLPADADLTEHTVLARDAESPCLPGSFCSRGVAFPCPAGRYGSRQEETSWECEGPCQEGYWCPEGSDRGTLLECGHPGFYCPRGSPHPLYVQLGYYTNEDAEITIRSRRILCPAGWYCPGDGFRYKCPAGRFGDHEGMSSEECIGPCRAGYYCPAGSPVDTASECGGVDVYCPRGSALPVKADPGFYTIATGPQVKKLAATLLNTTQSAQVLCEPGYYCVGGVKMNCPEGTFGSEYGQQSVHDCKPCLLGFRCPSYPGPGSSVADQELCGGPGVYCPQGTGNTALDVQAGYYTVGGGANNMTRAAQKQCEAGWYCRAGVKLVCPVGRYGATPGLKDATCTGFCPAGTYCPEGSTAPLPCPLGTYSYKGAAFCSPCPGGSTTTTQPTGSIKTQGCVNDRRCCAY